MIQHIKTESNTESIISFVTNKMMYIFVLTLWKRALRFSGVLSIDSSWRLMDD